MALSLVKEKCERICFFIYRAWLVFTVRKCAHWWLFPWAILSEEEHTGPKRWVNIDARWIRNKYPKLAWSRGGEVSQGRSSVLEYAHECLGPCPAGWVSDIFLPQNAFSALSLFLQLLLLFSVNLLLDFHVRYMEVVLNISSILPGNISMTLSLKYPFHSPLLLLPTHHP